MIDLGEKYSKLSDEGNTNFPDLKNDFQLWSFVVPACNLETRFFLLYCAYGQYCMYYKEFWHIAEATTELKIYSLVESKHYSCKK